ncbi:MAG: tetrahydromethanopterin S-methyltransferase subunit G [Methanothrix sp.]
MPSVVVDQEQYTQVLEKLAKIDQKIEFVSAEMAQRQGKKLGRDIGILYGACGGLIIVLAYYLLAYGLGV